MKKCKYCQSDIDPKAKVCPKCGKKQGMPKWLIVVIVILVIAVVGGGIGAEEEATSNSSSSKNVSEKKETKKSFESTETVTYKDVEYKIDNIERSSGSTYDKPEDGKEFMIITITIKNNSSKKVDYNTYDWKLTNSNGQENSETFTTVNDNALSSGSLASGGTVTGTLAYEIPQGDTGLKFSHYDTIIDDEPAFYFNIN